MKAKRTIVGELKVRPVGTRYYEGKAKTGDVVSLVREPKTPHDPKAIRVDNGDGKQIGHLPREIAAWLAQLLDDGRVRVAGRVETHGARRGGPEGAQLLTLEIHINPKGKSILEPMTCAGNKLAFLHNDVLGAFKQAKETTDAEHSKYRRERQALLAGQDMFPETRMLWNLLMSSAPDDPLNAADITISKVPRILDALKIGDPQRCGNITVFPGVLARQPGVRREPKRATPPASRRGFGRAGALACQLSGSRGRLPHIPCPSCLAGEGGCPTHIFAASLC